MNIRLKFSTIRLNNTKKISLFDDRNNSFRKDLYIKQSNS